VRFSKIWSQVNDANTCSKCVACSNLSSYSHQRERAGHLLPTNINLPIIKFKQTLKTTETNANCSL